MKAIRKIGMWKAIAFLTVVISFFSCSPEYPKGPLIKAVITVISPASVTENSATVMAMIIPNQDNTIVSIRYQADSSAWKTLDFPNRLSGTDSQTISFNLFDLLPGTSYKFEVTASNVAGETTVKGVSFTTIGLTKAVAKTKATENVTKTTAKLIASVIPNQNGTEIFMEYQTEKSAWISKSLGNSFSGKDSVKVTLDLSNLQLNTKYNFRVKIVNKAGEVLSDTASFETYAVSDYDGNLYHTVTIGTQTWLKENFKGVHFANDDSIPNVTDQTAWNNLVTPGYCYYNNDPKYAKVYGALYNFYAFNDSRGLIVGFHSPSLEEWTTLADYLGGRNIAGGKMKEAGYEHWIRPNAGATNESGFTGLPAGARQDKFNNFGDWAIFWSTTSFMGMPNLVFSPDLGECWAALRLNGGSSSYRGFSIRLLKN
ncbi:MAG: FISUMP domain-containing protein [Bacteroidales bacterium]|nr:FISUMP domain-containing protein [Bacteroidales bacterium]